MNHISTYLLTWHLSSLSFGRLFYVVNSIYISAKYQVSYGMPKKTKATLRDDFFSLFERITTTRKCDIVGLSYIDASHAVRKSSRNDLYINANIKNPDF